MMKTNERKQSARNRGPTPRKFWIHLGIFVVVNAGLITLNLVRSPHRYWFQWVLFGWGAGLLLNAYRVFGCCWTTGCKVNTGGEPATKDAMK
jgi:hypothetical protein